MCQVFFIIFYFFVNYFGCIGIDFVENNGGYRAFPFKEKKINEHDVNIESDNLDGVGDHDDGVRDYDDGVRDHDDGKPSIVGAARENNLGDDSITLNVQYENSRAAGVRTKDDIGNSYSHHKMSGNVRLMTSYLLRLFKSTSNNFSYSMMVFQKTFIIQKR